MLVTSPAAVATTGWTSFSQVDGRMSWPWCPIPAGHSGMSQLRFSQ